MTAITVATLGIALMAGLSFAASAIGTSITGMASVGAMKKNKGAFGNYMVLSALPGSQGLYGLVGYILLQDFLIPEVTMFQAWMIFALGIILGLASLVSSYMQAKVCANGIAAIGNGHNVLGNTLILAAFPELYSILAVALVFMFKGLMGVPGVA
jgi:V/A-type H+-transporting ATPase subunit K